MVGDDVAADHCIAKDGDKTLAGLVALIDTDGVIAEQAKLIVCRITVDKVVCTNAATDGVRDGQTAVLDDTGVRTVGDDLIETAFLVCTT